MKTEEIHEATQIIIASNKINVSYNVPIEDNYTNVYEILIHECTASLINNLIAAGFSLSMCEKGLIVDKY